MKIDIEKVSGFIREVAAEEVLPRWRNLSSADISEKAGPDDLVTVADKACERALSARLLGAYPRTLIVGEEGVEENPGLLQALFGEDPVWVIDPIDGTMGFSKGHPQFDIMVALIQRGELLAGWIYAPVDNDLYAAEKGAGCLRFQSQESTRLHAAGLPADVTSLTGIMGKKFFSEEQHLALKEKCRVFQRMLGTICAGHDYARLLRGEAQFAIYNKNMPWDHLPGLMLASELGFCGHKHDGSPYRPGDTKGGLFVSPASLTGALRALIY